MNQIPQNTANDIPESVARALHEDIGSGDISAELIDAQKVAKGTVISREKAVICGRAWVDEVFKQLDSSVAIEWHVSEGDWVTEDQPIFTVSGNARILLSGERCALNFLQTLSGTATTARQYAQLATNSQIRILDTRKTIPGLRLAQKYAISVGGCMNHRIGLYDAFLIKENHIIAEGSIANAVAKARALYPRIAIIVEVENLDELQQALNTDCTRILIDDFSDDEE